MGKAEERSTLYHQFLGLAEQIQRFMSPDRGQAPFQPARWKELTEPEVRRVLHRRDYILVPGAIPSADTLREWNAHAARVLKTADGVQLRDDAAECGQRNVEYEPAP